jgi:hypothetical protein
MSIELLGKDFLPQKRLGRHFDRREKSFLDPSHSFGMTEVGPSLSVVAPLREASSSSEKKWRAIRLGFVR